MGFLKYGSAKGLALRHDYGRDIDRLYEREAYRSQIEAEKEQKARYYSGLMQEHPSVAPSMTRELEGFYKDLNNQVADFAINNPNFETDVNKMQEFIGLTDQYLNNDMVRKDIQSQEQFAKFKESLNNGEIMEGSVEYEQEMDKYDSWLQNGGDGYVFTAKKLPTYGDIVENSNDAMKPDTGLKREGNMFLNVSATPMARVINQAQVDFLDLNKKTVIERRYAEVAEAEGIAGIYSNAFDFHVKTLAAGEEVKKTYATWDPSVRANAAAQAKLRADQQKEYPYYAQQIAPEFQGGKVIESDDGLEAFTPFGKVGRPINFGEQGIEIYIQDEKTGKLNPKRLKGEFSLTNVGSMRMTPTTGGMIECHVKTTVNSVEEHTGKQYKIIKDGTAEFLSQEELNQWMIDEDFNKKELQRMADAKSAKKGGSKYTYEEIEDKQNLGAYYNNLGFTNSGIIKEGLFDPLEGGKSTFPTYTGKIFINAIITPTTLNAYERFHGGLAHANIIHQAGKANRNQFMIEQTSAGNYEFAEEYMNDSFESGMTHYYTETGKKATKDSYDSKVTSGTWKKSPDHPGLYVRTNKVTTADGTVRNVMEGYNALNDQFYDIE